MSNFCYFHPSDNVAPNATVTTSGTADTSYPLTNATALAPAKLHAPSKLTGTSGAWVFDFGSAQRIDAVLIWHNFDEALSGVSWQMNAANSWGAPTVSHAFTVAAKRADGFTKKLFKDLTGVSGYSSGGFRYARLNVSGTNTSPIGIKVLIFSRIRTTTRNISWGLSWLEHQTGVVMSTDALVRWPYDLTAAPRLLSADIEATDADALALKEWMRACGGAVKPTVMVPDQSDPDPMFGYLTNGSGVAPISPSVQVLQQQDTHQFIDSRLMRIAIEEITAGDPEWY